MTEDPDDTVIVPRRTAAGGSTADNRDLVFGDTVVAGAPPIVAGSHEHLSHEHLSNGHPSAVTHAVPLYRFTIGENSSPVVLDAPAYIGRRPSGPRVASGISPRLVTVASPLHEVSATHLEIRQLGASVIVTDLRSTNGSVVMLPGNVPQKLRQGESLVVSAGTVIDIGDQNIIRILPALRSTQSPVQRSAQPQDRRGAQSDREKS